MHCRKTFIKTFCSVNQKLYSKAYCCGGIEENRTEHIVSYLLPLTCNLSTILFTTKGVFNVSTKVNGRTVSIPTHKTVYVAVDNIPILCLIQIVCVTLSSHQVFYLYFYLEVGLNLI